jgi:hypothetical protein
LNFIFVFQSSGKKRICDKRVEVNTTNKTIEFRKRLITYLAKSIGWSVYYAAWNRKLIGRFRGLNPGPSAPKAEIIPLDQTDTYILTTQYPTHTYRHHYIPCTHAQTWPTHSTASPQPESNNLSESKQHSNTQNKHMMKINTYSIIENNPDLVITFNQNNSLSQSSTVNRGQICLRYSSKYTRVISELPIYSTGGRCIQCPNYTSAIILHL